MITKHDDLLGTLIHDVAHLLRLDIDRRVAPHNLTRIKWLALGVIKKNPGLTQSELASELELGAAAVGRLIDRLEERDFIVRSPALDDRRAYTLDLTPAANALVLSLDATAQELKDDLLHSLSEQEISSLNRGLNKLKSNLQRLSATAISVFPLRPDTCAELQTTLCSVPLL